MSANDIQRIAVVGAGLMGHGIALEFAAHGFAVHCTTGIRRSSTEARDGIAHGLARLVEIERITPGKRPRPPSASPWVAIFVRPSPIPTWSSRRCPKTWRSSRSFAISTPGRRRAPFLPATPRPSCRACWRRLPIDRSR